MKYIWKAEGEDIYYQGNTKKELPIGCKITYRLDNRKVEKDEIVGKSGIVKIEFEFTNKEAREVVIDGKKQTIYVPFIVGMGTVFDNEKNKNIKITNGKVIDNGDKSIVLGFALPGMQESLGIDKNTVDIPSSVEITMEAKDFEMNEIYCFATPKIIDEKDLDIFNKIDKIYSMTNELKDGSNQLVQGTVKLADGANKLNSGTIQLAKELNVPIAKYENARKNLASKEELEEKIVNIISTEMNKLMPELKSLAKDEAKSVVKNNLKGANGLEAKTVETALNYSKEAINTKLDEIKNRELEINISDELLAKIKSDVEGALKKVISEYVNKVSTEIETKVGEDTLDAIKNRIKEKIVENLKKSVENDETIQKEILPKLQIEINSTI